MKKLLIASAALAMVAGTAQAQSSVTVYGIIDAGYNSLETTKTDNAKTTALNVKGDGEAASSRLGFRGTEDLGGGLKANFVIEQGINANTVTSFGDRAYWAGLEDAKMGQLRIGRQDAFTRSVWLGHDQLAAANVVGNLAHSGGSTIAPADTVASVSHTTRNTAINYISPRMSGIQASFGMMKNESETTTKNKNGSGYQAGLNYVAGKFSAAAAYADFTQNEQAASGVFGSTATSSIGVPFVSGVGKVQETAGAFSYDLGVAKVAYIYNKRDVSLVSADQRESHSFSASLPVNAKTTVRLGYGFGELTTTAVSSSGAQSAVAAGTGDLVGYQAAVNYDLSKRTMLYAIYGYEKRDFSATTSAKANEYSVGVRHSF